MMIEDRRCFAPRIETMRGLPGFYECSSDDIVDHECKSLCVVLDAAKQLDRFQPMLDAGKPYIAKGATFERPINYTTLWQLQPVSNI